MADVLDLLSLDEAREAANLTGTGQDAQLADFVTGISRRIDDLCGAVVRRAVTEELDGGDRRVWLAEPAAELTSVSEWSGGSETVLAIETRSSVPADGVLLDSAGDLSFVWRRSGGSDARFAAGRRNVVVVYQAGRFVDTEAVDPKFRLAAASILRRVHKRESSAWSQTVDFFPNAENPGPSLTQAFYKAVDPMVREFLGDELRHPPVG